MEPTLDIQWTAPLQFRRGAKVRLEGIAVFHDFEWSDYFSDQRTQFSNGLSLVKQLKKDCPTHLEPALLLSAENDVEEGAREIGDHYVLVVDLPRYLETASADAASAYFAEGLGPGITRAKGYTDLAEADLASLLDARLDEEALLRWANKDDERFALLRSLADQHGDENEDSTSDAEAIVSTVQGLAEVPIDLILAVADAVNASIDGGPRTELLAALTGDVDGRYVASETLANRAVERLGDARAAIKDFDALIAAGGSSETDLQEFLELNPWLLGLDYARVRPRQNVPRGAVDFLLERFDGYHDVLELKGPRDKIFVIDRPRHGRPASASGYRLSRALSLAVAQVHAYRDLLRHEEIVREQFGIENSRDPRFIIIIGTVSSLGDEGQRILRELNKSLHRVEIVPYDVVGLRAEAILENVEQQLLFTSGEAPEGE